MKNLFKLPVLVLGLILLLAGTTQKAVAQEYDVSLQTFYDELSPYGTWIQDREYGYVWRPDVDQRDFRPYYSDGRWVMTEYGNTWVSEYDWGWAPFHYGRWVNNRYNEWVWIPDTVWGPAWVSWRSGGGYYGWAPLGPGININIGGGGYYDIPQSWWVFIPQRNIYYDRFPRYRGNRNVNIYNNTTIINYTGQRNRHNYYTGPRRDDIRRATNRDVPVYNVNRSNRAGRSTIANNTVNIYNPRSSRSSDNNSGRTPAPKAVVTESTYSNNRGNVTRGNATPTTRNNTESRTNRTSVERGTNRTETSAAQRAERSRQQTEQTQQNRTSAQQGTAPSRTQRTQRVEQSQAQQQERSREQQATTQAQAERTQRVQQAQAQQQERSREQQAQAQQQERGRQQQAQAQQQQQERSRQQQQQQQQRQSAPRPEVQQQRQERPQAAPQQSSGSRGGEASSGSRSSRSNRG